MFYTVQIGNILLGAGTNSTRFEVPEELDDGTDVHLGIHRYVDETGNPVIRTHPMGAFPVPQKWKGEFAAGDALYNHNQMKLMTSRMDEITVTYGSLSWLGVIQKYVGKIKHQNLVEYEMDIIITHDLNGTNSGLTVDARYDQGSEQLHQIAVAALTGPNAAGLPQDLKDKGKNLEDALGKAGPLKNSTAAQISALAGKVDTYVNQLNAFAKPLGIKIPTAGVSQLLGTVQLGANAYGLMSKNMKVLAGSPSTAATIATVQSGVSMFAVAAKYFPKSDISTTATAISQANNLATMFTSTHTTLRLPSLFNKS